MSHKKGPKLRNTFNEFSRAVAENKVLREHYKKLLTATPNGNGEPVLVIPGFANNDSVTAKLRKFIDQKGYKSYGWENGINLGPSERTLQHLKDRLHDIHDKHNGKKVTLIGFSLGGIYARELAREYPHLVKQSITMGSPFGMGNDPNVSMKGMHTLFSLINRNNRFLTDEQLVARSLMPPSAPTTSIYTRNDGIVHWTACINPKDKKTENIEVDTGHMGLVVNAGAYLVIADRLAQSEWKWKKFDKKDYPDFEEFFVKPPAHKGKQPQKPNPPKGNGPDPLFG